MQVETSHDTLQSPQLEYQPPTSFSEMAGPSEGPTRTLQINFQWRKWRAMITEVGSDTPIYVVKQHPITMKMTFKSGPAAFKAAALERDSDTESNIDESVDFSTEEGTIGTGSIHGFKIDCHTVIHGTPVRVSAAKKWLTRYNYPSPTLRSPTDPSAPSILTWKSSSKLRIYDMVLLDSSDTPLAKLIVNYTGLKKWAKIELYGPAATDDFLRDEIVITGYTVFNCMLLRSSSFVSFFGAAVARPGKDYKVTEKVERERAERAVGSASASATRGYGQADEDEDWDRETIVDKRVEVGPEGK